MRLDNTQIKNIVEIIRTFDPEANVRLFGSRVNDQEKGGDIDLLVLSKKITYRDKLMIRSRLKQRLGDRKIDLIVTENPNTAFEKYAYDNSMAL